MLIMKEGEGETEFEEERKREGGREISYNLPNPAFRISPLPFDG